MKTLLDSIYALITRETDEGPVYDLSRLDDVNTQITFWSLMADLSFKAGRHQHTQGLPTYRLPQDEAAVQDVVNALYAAKTVLKVYGAQLFGEGFVEESPVIQAIDHALGKVGAL